MLRYWNLPRSTLLAWPAGIIKGSYFLSYGVFVYQILFRRYQFGDASFAVVLRRAAGANYLAAAFYVLVIVLAVIVLLRHGKRRPALSVFACYAVITFIQGIANKFHNPTYVSHFEFALWSLFALSLASLFERTTSRSLRTSLVGGLALIIIVSGLHNWQSVRDRVQLAQESGDRIAAALTTVTALPRGSAKRRQS